jgi:hypothetical protein
MREPLILLGFPLERHFCRRPWLALVFVAACYVVGALIDGAN